MAVLKRKVPHGVDGNYFVDTTCINCDASRKYAPAIFGDTGDYAFVKKQPNTPEECSGPSRLCSPAPWAPSAWLAKLGITPDQSLSETLRKHVTDQIGALARP